MNLFSFRRPRESCRRIGDGDDRRGLVEDERTEGATAGFQVTTTFEGDVFKFQRYRQRFAKKYQFDTIFHARSHEH